MIAITSAMIVPSISIVSQGSIEDESNRLRLVMRYALEESQLTGIPLRWLATKDGWYFEALEQGETNAEWLAYEDAPIKTYILPVNITIEAVQQASDFTLNMEVKPVENGEQPIVIIGMVLLLPDGTTSQSDIRMTGEDTVKVLEIRPGPAGIKFKKPDV
jgi:hypothetical protein